MSATMNSLGTYMNQSRSCRWPWRIDFEAKHAHDKDSAKLAAAAAAAGGGDDRWPGGDAHQEAPAGEVPASFLLDFDADEGGQHLSGTYVRAGSIDSMPAFRNCVDNEEIEGEDQQCLWLSFLYDRGYWAIRNGHAGKTSEGGTGGNSSSINSRGELRLLGRTASLDPRVLPYHEPWEPNVPWRTRTQSSSPTEDGGDGDGDGDKEAAVVVVVRDVRYSKSAEEVGEEAASDEAGELFPGGVGGGPSELIDELEEEHGYACHCSGIDCTCLASPRRLARHHPACAPSATSYATTTTTLHGQNVN
jgi:hypothetical protein